MLLDYNYISLSDFMFLAKKCCVHFAISVDISAYGLEDWAIVWNH